MRSRIATLGKIMASEDKLKTVGLCRVGLG